MGNFLKAALCTLFAIVGGAFLGAVLDYDGSHTVARSVGLVVGLAAGLMVFVYMRRKA